ncbi:uncharacterized protein BDW43DRAFT_279015 [Aspergillus alliaceus]|uniref:uncharacterized protein n=1 Tax=Petromyces alliaceus TaxID=209559 RepID=UPI0012A3C5CA|nr:uncharacterized protein BDW43DRAFT_279015 [Aspergillus alliaceus]KAB8232592.1 hypothetical protein BDW43DRAFT_279015 [Aspergillus alliaceus]
MIRAKALDKGTVNRSNKPLTNTIFFFLFKCQSVLEIVVVAVVPSRVMPNSTLRCHIEEQWQSYFQAKYSCAFRTIQTKLQCRGIRSLHDRVWPFKDREHGDNTCEVQLGYQRSYYSPWKEQQRLVSS